MKFRRTVNFEPYFFSFQISDVHNLVLFQCNEFFYIYPGNGSQYSKITVIKNC